MKPLTSLVITVVVAAIAGAAGAYSIIPHSTVTDSTKEESVFHRVMRKGEIRCGYFIEPSMTAIDPNTGKLSGAVVELTEALAKDLNLKVVWAEEINASTMIEGLNTNRYDALCASIWNITSRAREMEHSIPYAYSPVGVFVRANDNRFDNKLDVIDDPAIKIAGIDGDGATLISVASFPKATLVMLPQFSNLPELMVNVAMRKADVAFATIPTFKEYDKQNPGQLKNVAQVKPFNVMGNSFTFKKGEVEMKTMFDNAIMTYVNNGKLDKIIDKYEEFPGSLYHVAKPYLIAK